MTIDVMAIDTLVHPRTTTLVFPRVEVEIKLTDDLACRRINLVKPDAVIPALNCFVDRFDMYAIESGYNLEQAIDNLLI